MRCMIIGGNGLVGHALTTHLRRLNHEVFFTSRSGVADADGFFMDLEYKPEIPIVEPDVDVVYLVAAVTKVVDCEANPQDTWKVNADAPALMALQAKERKIHSVFISSDAVERAPALNYSRQKAYAEGIVLTCGGTVVRPSRIPADKVEILCRFLEGLGDSRKQGLFRWDPNI